MYSGRHYHHPGACWIIAVDLNCKWLTPQVRFINACCTPAAPLTFGLGGIQGMRTAGWRCHRARERAPGGVLGAQPLPGQQQRSVLGFFEHFQKQRPLVTFSSYFD
jgi:hypothetical protein